MTVDEAFESLTEAGLRGRAIWEDDGFWRVAAEDAEMQIKITRRSLGEAVQKLIDAAVYLREFEAIESQRVLSI